MATDNKLSDIEQTKRDVSLEEYAKSHLEQAHGGLVCPCCGSGKGQHGTPAFSIDRSANRWKCFACGKSGDVLDLAGAVTGTDSVRDQLEAVRSWAGLATHPIPYRKQDTMPERREEPKTDYSSGRENERAYITASRAAMQPGTPGHSYLLNRGFSNEEIEAYGFGWDPAKQRVVIPWSTEAGEYYHIDRDVTGLAPNKYSKPKKDSVGPQPLHNAKALNGPYVFVVEGLMDAYAVESAGQPAIALAGTGYTDLLRHVSETGYSGLIILMLDNDETGREKESELREALERTRAAVWEAEYKDGMGKDASEALERDRSALGEFLANQAANGAAMAEKLAEERYQAELKDLRALDPSETAASIWACEDEDEPTPTGLTGLDAAIGGGLKRGVYVLGAISSLGKTTLTVQVADHIAETGRGVLFVTIEQSAREIVSKSLTRLMRTMGKGGAVGRVATWELGSSTERKKWSAARHELFQEACNRYEGIAANMRILEASKQPSVEDIRRVAQIMTEHDGRPPVVFIDYLQLLKPPSERDSDKQATDKNMMELRQMARDLKATVVVISSLNRSSYSGSISLDSFKESGGIEYGADVLLGLQPAAINEVDGLPDAKAKAEAKRIMREVKASEDRTCEIVVLKNRNWRVPKAAPRVTFHAASSMFEDAPELPMEMVNGVIL